MNDAPQHAPGASLTWGLKQSFRSYVEATGGTIETGSGAARADDGAITFPVAPDSAVTLDAEGRPQGRVQFLGDVRFAAHGGMLSVCLADPAVEFGPSGGVLTVADSLDRKYRLEIAQLDLDGLSAGDDGELIFPTSLLMAGCQLLDNHYPATTPLDPVRLKLATPGG